MAQSSAVTANTLATAAQYNNLRLDVLSTSVGHLHDGTNGRSHTEVVFTTGVAVTATAYSVGKDDSTVLHSNVPTGATFEWSVNDTAHLTLGGAGMTLAASLPMIIGDLIEWTDDSGAGVDGTKYQIGRDDGSKLHFNVPTANVYEWSVNDVAVVLLSATAMTFTATVFPILPITDTDGTVEGSLWYDASEDKLKFKTAAGVETITSS